MGILAPRAVYLSGFLRKSTTFLELELGAVDTRDVDKGDASLGNLLELGLGLAEIHGAAAAHAAEAAAALAALRAAEEEEETAKGEEREEEVAEEGGVVALLVTLRHGDVDAVLGEDVHELGVVRQGDGRAAAVDGGELKLGAVLAEAHALNLSGHHRADKLGVAPVVALGQAIRGDGGGGGRLGVAGEGGLRLRLELGEGGGGGRLGGRREVVGERPREPDPRRR